MSDFGIKVSREGYDVKTATTDELAFSSGFNYLKQHTYTRVNAEIPAGGSDAIVTISHSLGYVPYVEAFYQIGSVSADLSPVYSFYNDLSLVDYISVLLSISATTITLSVLRDSAFSSTGTNAISVPLYVFIYVEGLE